MSEESTTSAGSESSNKETSSEPSSSRTTASSQREIFPLNSYSTSTSSQTEIFSHSVYDAYRESSSRETSRPSSPEFGNVTARTLYSSLPEMAIVHQTIHDAIHTVREQQGRALMRSLFQQQKTLVANKLQCTSQIKRTSIPDPSNMSNIPPR